MTVKYPLVLVLILSVCIGLGSAAYQNLAPEPRPLTRYVPAGALLYLEAKDFSSLLAKWNNSPEQQRWKQSSNYEVFSQSRLFLRLKDARDQFVSAAGLPPDGDFTTEAIGTTTALALYDIGKLHFLYITKIPSAHSMQSLLWQTRAKFETRSAGGVTFYVRRDFQIEREVAFTINGDYLLLATREELLAGALKLMAESKDRTIEAEPWWSQAVAAAGPAGDLRLVLNLEKIVPSPYFRSYWIQQNITEMKQYSAAVTDLFGSGDGYREERVLLKKTPSGGASHDTGSAAVADLLRLVPADAGAYEARSNPSAEDCAGLLQSKILAPQIQAPAARRTFAPQLQLASGATGNSSDLETRIDKAPVRDSIGNDAPSALKGLFQKNRVQAILQVQNTDKDKDGVFVGIHSAIALLGDDGWNETEVRAALAEFLRPELTAGKLGIGWQTMSAHQELDGLRKLTIAVRGRYWVISDDPALMSTLLANMDKKIVQEPAVFVAGFNHTRERENFARLSEFVDRQDVGRQGYWRTGQTPRFLSQNIASLSAAAAGIGAQKIVFRDAGDKVLQTVTYERAD